mgnify:CR=1 FL=1
MKTEVITAYQKHRTIVGLKTYSGVDVVVTYKRNGKIDKVFVPKITGYDGEYEIRELTASQFELEYSLTEIR